MIWIFTKEKWNFDLWSVMMQSHFLKSDSKTKGGLWKQQLIYMFFLI